MKKLKCYEQASANNAYENGIIVNHEIDFDVIASYKISITGTYKQIRLIFLTDKAYKINPKNVRKFITHHQDFFDVFGDYSVCWIGRNMFVLHRR